MITRIVLLALLTTSCSSTTFRSTWKAPDAAPMNYKGKKVAAIFISPEEGTRRAAEDALAQELTDRGAQGVSAYTLLSLEDLKDEKGARTKLREAGCAGAVTMRVTGQEQKITSTPGTYSGLHYGTYSGYSSWGWNTVYEPGYLSTSTVVLVETLVYDLDSDKLLWGGTSETFEPSKTTDFVLEIARSAADEMKEDGLIAE